MRFSIGVYLRILSLCSANGVNEHDVLKKLVLAVDPDRSYELNLQYAQRLAKCQNDLKKPCSIEETANLQFADVVNASRGFRYSDIAPAFLKHIVPLIKESMKENVLLAFQKYVAKDAKSESSGFAKYVGMTQEGFIGAKKLNLPEVLAGLFLYSILEPKVKEGRGCDASDDVCGVILAKTVMEKKRDKNGKIADNYRNDYHEAIKVCGKSCVLCITDKDIESFDAYKGSIEVIETIATTSVATTNRGEISEADEILSEKMKGVDEMLFGKSDENKTANTPPHITVTQNNITGDVYNGNSSNKSLGSGNVFHGPVYMGGHSESKKEGE